MAQLAHAAWPGLGTAAELLLDNPFHLFLLQAFAEHIKFCANKLQLGVNFLPNTPNYDRVVEMQVCGCVCACVKRGGDASLEGQTLFTAAPEPSSTHMHNCTQSHTHSRTWLHTHAYVHPAPGAQ